jgi:hypothetical protein
MNVPVLCPSRCAPGQPSPASPLPPDSLSRATPFRGPCDLDLAPPEQFTGYWGAGLWAGWTRTGDLLEVANAGDYVITAILRHVIGFANDSDATAHTTPAGPCGAGYSYAAEYGTGTCVGSGYIRAQRMLCRRPSEI